MTLKNIALNRNFFRVSEESAESGDYDATVAYAMERSVHWDDVLTNKRVVIIAEAGAGKTHELLHTAKKLKESGKSAFFIRLEYLKDGIETAFDDLGNEDYLDFKVWKESSDEGYFFLDSVDEAKLEDPRQFEQALRKLKIELKHCFGNTTIVISSRPTFQPRSELQLFNQHLPCPPTQEKDEDNVDEDRVEENKAVIYSLASLDEQQIKIYSKEKGVSDITNFMESIERSGAQSYATRPRDLDGIISYWQVNQKIGSKLDVMQANIKRRTEENDPVRDQLSPLTIDQVMDGIQTIAAVCTLTEFSRIAVPDREPSINAVSIKQVLPNWSPAEQLALLQRPIFDDAAYGTVRFHDRDIREYLSSKWLEQLLKTGSRRKVEGLFFKTLYGVEVTRPKLRQILPWVALNDDHIRERALKVNPSILLDGGDPTKFPSKFKEKVLRASCKEMAENEDLWYSYNIYALTRFADENLTQTIKELFKHYHEIKGVIDLLLKMVWQGKLLLCKEEALTIALNKESKKYTRIYAIRACNSICSNDEIKSIINQFVDVERGKDRDIAGELVTNFYNEISTSSLIKMVKQLSLPNRHHFSGLNDSLKKLAYTQDLSKLENIFKGLSELALQEPHIEKRHIEVSKQYHWLIKSISCMAEELIGRRSRVMLEPLALEALSQCATCSESGYTEDFKNKLRLVVPKWEELNYESFWHSTTRVGRYLDKSVTFEGQVGICAHFWNLSDVALMQALNWIKERSKVDDKLVALSIAFRIYKENGRKPAERKQLKASCNGNQVLESELQSYLRPPAMSDAQKKYSRSNKYYEKRQIERQAKREANLDRWREYAAENLDKVGYIDKNGCGRLYDVQKMLYQRMSESQQGGGKLAKTDWKSLIEDQNFEVANTFKNTLVEMWKYNEPPMCFETGAYSTSISYDFIFGLSGLAILNLENPDWVSTISIEEAEIACRYALHEINGVPDWLEKLHEVHPEIVVQVFFKEMQWELFTYAEDKPLHYVVDTVYYHCRWMAPKIATLLLKEIVSKETRFEEILKRCLGIILSSQLISKRQIEELSICKIENQSSRHMFLWFSALVSVSPEDGIKRLTKFLEAFKDVQYATEFAMKFIVSLVGSRRMNPTDSLSDSYKEVEHLKNLYILMNRYIKLSEDIDRTKGGVYSPELRDDAQDARNFLLEEIKKHPGKEAYVALKNLSHEHPHKEAQKWMRSHAQSHLENEADLSAWNIEDILSFVSSQECKPHTPRDLFDVSQARLLDLKTDLEHSEDSVASSWAKEDQEPKLRILIAKWLRERTNSVYSVHQEEEQADGKKPDIRLNSEAFDAPTPIELKIADNWSGNQLIERLENQLCNDYLRDYRTKYGIFLLVYRAKKSFWELSSKRVNFDDLVKLLRRHANDYIKDKSNIEDIEVIGIDLAKRSTPIRNESD